MVNEGRKKRSNQQEEKKSNDRARTRNGKRKSNNLERLPMACRCKIVKMKRLGVVVDKVWSKKVIKEMIERRRNKTISFSALTLWI